VIEIRSYRRVFDLERRLYRIDRLRLNPGGVPVRGVLYFAALLTAVLIAGSLPLVGSLSRALPWYVRDVAAPGASATLLSLIRLEGRPFHLAAYALVRYRIEPRRLSGCRPCDAVGTRWRPHEIVLLPDGSDSRMRRLRYAGPGAVLVTLEHERSGAMLARRPGRLARLARRPDVILRERPHARVLDRSEVIALGSGARLLVRSSGAAGGR
jgi:hypothetical protein